MPKIPAICRTCGLMFPSGLAYMGPGMIVSRSFSGCPRCRSDAPILSGYTTLISGLVAFIISDEIEFSEKQRMIDAATSISSGKVRPAEAIASIDGDGAKVLREWTSLGISFASLLVAVASLLLAYSTSGGNQPLDSIAMEKFDETLATIQQPDSRIAPAYSQRPVAMGSKVKPQLKQGQAPTTSAKPPNENRKARRARMKKERTNKGK